MKVFLDIETTDTVPGAGVWEIGALILHEGRTHRWSTRCRPTGTTSQEAMEWIANRPAVAERHKLALESPMMDIEAAALFADFICNLRGSKQPDRHHETFYSWGTFDFPILGNIYKRSIAVQPWHYGSECDLRSVAKFLATDRRPDTSKHAALSDAEALYDFYKSST